MKKIARLLGLGALALVVPCLHAADWTGTWKGNFEFQGTTVPIALHLAATGEKLTGSVERPDTPAVEIHDGEAKEKTVSFWINAEYDGTMYKVVFRGADENGRMKLIFGTEDGSWGTETTLSKEGGAGQGIEAGGSWKGSFEFEGTEVPLSFHLKTAEGKVTGTVEGLPAGVAEIHDGLVEGAEIRFSITTSYQGEAVKLVYRGRVGASEIQFSFGTDDGRWSTEMKARKA